MTPAERNAALNLGSETWDALVDTLAAEGFHVQQAIAAVEHFHALAVGSLVEIACGHLVPEQRSAYAKSLLDSIAIVAAQRIDAGFGVRQPT